MRMGGTLEEFSSAGGQEAFMQKLADSLGIDVSQIQIKSVSAGSIVVVYDLTPAPGQSLEDLKDVQNAAIAGGTINTGFELLDVGVI